MVFKHGLWRRLSAEELMLLNCGVGEDSWESLGLQRDPTSPFWRSTLDFFGRNDAKAETPVLWPPHVKSWLIGKDPDAGRDWGQEEKGTTEDEMAGWHHWLDERESEWTPGVGDGQGGLACCYSWGHKESDMTATELNWTELMLWKLECIMYIIVVEPSTFLFFMSHGTIMYFNVQTTSHSSCPYPKPCAFLFFLLLIIILLALIRTFKY